MSVLIFRPQQKCVNSAARFAEAGLPAIGIGLIDTQVCQLAVEKLPITLATLKQSDCIIVTSTVAGDLLNLHDVSLPAHVNIFAVGTSTANNLRAQGYKVAVPQSPTTEGLLALKQLAELSGRSVVIIKGEGGRQDLAQQLTQRDANVYVADIYQRIKIATPKATQQWQAEQIRCIIATSGEMIESAFEQFEAKWLQSVPWIVVSPRTEQIAAKLGINTIFVSDDASDQALIRRAKEFLEH